MSPNSNVSPEVGEDRISELSDDIALLILSSVSTVDAVRMSSVSRCWHRMWCSLTVLDFDERCAIKSFCPFVTRCLDQRQKDLTVSRGLPGITTFRLALRPFWLSVVDRWLIQVGKSGVRELDLSFYPTELPREEPYHLRTRGLPGMWLTHLRLTNIDIEDLFSIGFPRLKNMSLSSVKLNNHVLSDLLWRCKALEELTLLRCTGLSNPTIASLFLKFLHIDGALSQTVLVVTENLESFVYDGEPRFPAPTLLEWPQLLTFQETSLRNIRNLTLSGGEWFDNPLRHIAPELSCLETLTLHGKLDGFKIQSRSLRRCVFSTASERARVIIDAPNLAYFSVEACRVELSLSARSVSETKVEFRDTEYNSEWYTGLIRFLQQLDCSRKVKLRVHSHQALIFPEEVRLAFTAPILSVEDLTLDVKEPSPETASALEDTLRWLTNSKA